MEKERAIQCVPVELMERLKSLAAKLWDDKNPASVHLNAIMEEFEPDVKSLGHIIKEYETDYSGRLAFNQGENSQKEGRYRKEIEDLKAKLAGLETSRAEALKRLEELRGVLAERENALAGLRMKSTETEGELNTKYVSKMQELYEKINRKELDMLSRWEEKNKALETRSQEMEAEASSRNRQLRLREKTLEEDFNARKAELIRTFDRIREGLDARERAIAAREAQKPSKGGI